MVLQKLHTPFNYKDDVITAYIKEIKNWFSELMYDIFYYVPGILQPRTQQFGRHKRGKRVQLQVIRKALFLLGYHPKLMGGCGTTVESLLEILH